MKDVARTQKLLVVAGADGAIMAAVWPGRHSEGAPSETGIGLAEGQRAHEVEVPKELMAAAQPDLGGYALQVAKNGTASLTRR